MFLDASVFFLLCVTLLFVFDCDINLKSAHLSLLVSVRPLSLCSAS